jgi:hypothetical protein
MTRENRFSIESAVNGISLAHADLCQCAGFYFQVGAPDTAAFAGYDRCSSSVLLCLTSTVPGLEPQTGDWVP